ncbi:MAG: RsmG family class I SAM-dependent methyltransferase, partial [Gammaproteobacteria bacterium]
AVGSLDMLMRLAMPMSRDDGRILAMKGSYPAAEIEALGPRVAEAQVHRLEVPALTEPRHLVVIRMGLDNARGYYGGRYRGSV